MTKSISPLRQRMIDDMKIRNISPNTQYIYISAVARFSAYHPRSPDKLGLEDIRNYHLHLVSRKLKPTTINPIMGALRFFYGIQVEPIDPPLNSRRRFITWCKFYQPSKPSQLMPVSDEQYR
jgi:integrase/recombinase XerD